MSTVPAIVAVMVLAALTPQGAVQDGGQPAHPPQPPPVQTRAASVVASESTQTPAAVARPKPTLRSQAITGVDKRVLAEAPAPDHDSIAAMAAGTPRTTRPALAATLTLAKPAALVAVTAGADFAAGTHIQVRVKQKSGWSAWNELGVNDGHGPDSGSAEAKGARVGSDPLMTVGASKAQVRIDTPNGRVPRGVKLSAVTAPTSKADSRLGATGRVATAGRVGQAAVVPSAASAAPAMPPIITRAQWGADERWRRRAPVYTDNVRVGFVHHTASSSKYSAAEAAAQVRAIYAYHTRSLGHSDIDYNFVVDRFGRLYEGRAGGMVAAVVGGHTAGFNEHSFAVVGLGNFQSFIPSSAEMAAMKDSIARLFAWKLSLSGINPGAAQQLISDGYIKATRYNKGAIATLPALSSHQMVNYTACPGTNLQSALPELRRLAAGYSNVVISAPSPPVESFPIGTRSSVSVSAWTSKAVTWRADVLSPCSDVPVRSFSGRAAAGTGIPVVWDLRDSQGNAVLPAQYSIRMTGTADDGSPVQATSATLSITPTAGGSWGPCGNVSRVIGATPADTSVLWGRMGAPAAKTVIVTGYSSAGAAALAAGLAAVPLARRLQVPLLVTPPGSLAGAVATEIRRRGAKQVLIVGGTGVVSAAAAKSLAATGAAVTRLSGSDATGTARAVAARMGYTGAPMMVDPVGSPMQAVASASLAAARGIPVGIAPASAVSGQPAVADPVAAARVVADAHPAAVQTVMVLPSNQVLATAAVAASLSMPVLVSEPWTPSASVLAYLAAHPGIRSALTPASSGALGDNVLGAASRVLKGEPSAPGAIRADSGLTAKRKLSRANASPEPGRAKRPITVSAQVKGKYGDGAWRAIPAGLPFDVQFKAKGKKKYVRVASGLTQAGRARLAVQASKSGRWRIVITGKPSASDYVTVRK